MPDLDPDAATWLATCCCPGDHRFVILDVHMDALVGNNIFCMVHPAAQHLSCTILKALVQYNKLLTTFFHTHQLLTSLHRMSQDRQGNFTVEQAKWLQGLDML